MRFDFDDEQREIKDTARQFLGARFKPEVVRELAEDGTYDDALWAEVSELGWPGIAIAEEYGGQGLGMVELVILCEELGYACAPLPFLSNACAGLVIEGAGSDEQKARWLPGIASGEGRGAFGGPERDRSTPRAPACAIVYGADGRDARGRPRRRRARAARADRLDPPLLGAARRRGRRAGRRRRRRRRPGPDARRRRGRPRRRRAEGDGDGRRVRQGARAVRPPDRRLPGRLPPVRARCSTTSRRRAR